MNKTTYHHLYLNNQYLVWCAVAAVVLRRTLLFTDNALQPDFVLLAEAYGAVGYGLPRRMRVTSFAQCSEENERPVIIISVEREANVFLWFHLEACTTCWGDGKMKHTLTVTVDNQPGVLHG